MLTVMLFSLLAPWMLDLRPLSSMVIKNGRLIAFSSSVTTDANLNTRCCGRAGLCMMQPGNPLLISRMLKTKFVSLNVVPFVHLNFCSFDFGYHSYVLISLSRSLYW